MIEMPDQEPRNLEHKNPIDRLEHKGLAYDLEWARLEDMPGLYQAYERVFGQDITPVEVFSAMITKRPDMVWRVIREDKLVGFFDIEALSHQGVLKMAAGTITGMSLTPEDIAEPGEKPAAYYVGSVGATSRNPVHRMATWSLFMRQASLLCLNESVDVYTNPVTDDGLRLALGFGFTRIGDSPIWKAELPQGTILR